MFSLIGIQNGHNAFGLVLNIIYKVKVLCGLHVMMMSLRSVLFTRTKSKDKYLREASPTNSEIH